MPNSNSLKEQNKHLAPIGLRAFFRLADQWELTVPEQMTLLGHPSRSTFYNWKADRISGVPHDTLSRLSHMIAIHRALGILFPETSEADAWVKKANDELAGQTVIDRLLAGELTDLAQVRSHLDALVAGS